MVEPAEFRPPWPLASAHVQSVLASSALRGARARARHGEFLALGSERLLDCGDGVRLQAFVHPHPGARGLVILLHGWEGSVESSYLIAAGGRLWQAGYAVARFNFRDHGDTHHLNRELFHSCRLDEVIGAVGALLALCPERPAALVGFSLGGNFALRVALHAPKAGLDLRHVIAVCPPIEPAHSLAHIEAAPWFYEQYFVQKWTRSLKRKMALFPEHYPIQDWLRRPRLRGLTERLVERYTDFGRIERYLDGYSVGSGRLRRLDVPATVLAAADDPVIPIGDFLDLELPGHSALRIMPRGGHCGFIHDFGLRSWAEDFILARLAAALGT